MNTLEILKTARKLIDTPARWTKGVVARDQFGIKTDPSSEAAVCWCSIGALLRAIGSDGPEADRLIKESASKLRKAAHCIVIGAWNDEVTHPEVLAAFDTAIATEEARACTSPSKK